MEGQEYGATRRASDVEDSGEVARVAVTFSPDLETQRERAIRASANVGYKAPLPPPLTEDCIGNLELLAARGPMSNADFFAEFTKNRPRGNRTPLVIVLGWNSHLRAHGYAGWIDSPDPTHAITDEGLAFLAATRTNHKEGHDHDAGGEAQ